MDGVASDLSCEHDTVQSPDDDVLIARPENCAEQDGKNFPRGLVKNSGEILDAPLAKKLKLSDQDEQQIPNSRSQALPAGTAPINAEYLVHPVGSRIDANETDRDVKSEKPPKDHSKRKQKGQNTQRSFGSSRDALQLCLSRALTAEFSPAKCPFGDACKYEHDLRKYLQHGKRVDLATFGGDCPIFAARGLCEAGWRCRFASSHSEEVSRDDGRKELILIKKHDGSTVPVDQHEVDEDSVGIVNVVPVAKKIDLRKRKFKTPKADAFTEYLNKIAQHSDSRKQAEAESIEENRALYVEPPFLPSEKRRIYYGPETPVLAPLTTQGNLPFRRLCVELGAQITWSEMAMGQPLIQGEKAEWALMKAHESEMSSPKCSSDATILAGYNNAQDIRFGAQIAANKPWLALKATEVITSLCPNLRAVDLNCGCPIDLVFRQGAGSALLDRPAQLEKILRGMNAVSGEVPISAKIRMGTRDDKPTAQRLIERLTFGGQEAYDLEVGPPGVAAVCLHGRSRQQRYTKSADWSYISECAALIKTYNQQKHDRLDTLAEADERRLPSQKDGKMYFIGNGDCYSHIDYYEHIQKANVDAVMVARGALIKPWIFEEIENGQYLDKSASERLQYVEKYARYGLENWGSDEIGVGITRRFLLEWLSFACRYIPIGILDHLPPRIQDRPPAYKGRDDLETLMASDNYKDWIKISEWFLGPAHEDFRFEPKHKSNSYEQAEG